MAQVTWGVIRRNIVQRLPGYDLTLVDDWIRQTYQRILDMASWEGETKDGVLVTVAEHTAGTVDLTNGSPTVAGTATAWTFAAGNRELRAVGESTIYSVQTVVSPTEITLDRDYEGTTAAGKSYRVFQRFFDLPADFEAKLTMRSPYTYLPIDAVDRRDLNIAAPGRTEHGEPTVCAPYPPSIAQNGLTTSRLELYPIPTASKSYPYTYEAGAANFSKALTASYPLGWVRESAIVEGVLALAMTDTNLAQAQMHEARFQAQVRKMWVADQRRQGPHVMRPSERITHGRGGRLSRGPRFPSA